MYIRKITAIASFFQVMKDVTNSSVVSVSQFSSGFLNKECKTLVESDLVVETNYSIILITGMVPTTMSPSEEVKNIHKGKFRQYDI